MEAPSPAQKLHFNGGHINFPAGGAPRGCSSFADEKDSDVTSFTSALSAFNRAEGAPLDPILSMRDRFLADPAPVKLNLAVGVYRTVDNQPLVLPSVQAAEEVILEKQKQGKTFKEYLPPTGMEAFATASIKLLLGDTVDRALDEKRVVMCQSLSGTGGLYLAARMIKEVIAPNTIVHLPSPTWPIHPDIFQNVGLQTATYPYYDPATCSLDFDGMLASLSRLPHGSVFLMHACAHNPTGVDLTKAQWRQVAEVVGERSLIPLIDSAYQGLASGDLDEDGYGPRTLAALPNIEMLCVQSFSKNMGLYAERAGCFSMICNDAEVAERCQQQVGRVCRLTHSSPPQHGALIAAAILADAQRTAQWRGEVRGMAERMRDARVALSAALKKHAVPPPKARGGSAGSSAGSAGEDQWPHVLAQRGMFTYTGLSVANVTRLREVHHVYMPMDGRISMASLNTESADLFARAIKEVLEFDEVATEATKSKKQKL